MNSVTGLDKDLKRLRLSKYTPQAANEVRTWIEEILGESLGDGDLLDSLKDGIVLCKYALPLTQTHVVISFSSSDAKFLDRLVNVALPSPGVKYKASKMPFVQRENISHFLRAVQSSPLSLPDHDIFLTVDLYERKDPAQVLQCLGAFSRRANILQPSRFPRTLGPKSRTAALSPQGTGGSDGWRSPGTTPRARGVSNASQSSVSTSATGTTRSADAGTAGGADRTRPSPRGGISTWSKRTDEGNTMPAWNIHQYGYMGGASQGNQGVSFGATRQITSSAPVVESLAERERRRQEQQVEQERLRFEREAEEERERMAEEERWKEETRKRLEQERLAVEVEKARWEEEERRWKEEEERREKADRETQARLEAERRRTRVGDDARLNGQFLSQYLSERGSEPKARDDNAGSDIDRERERVRQLERELELAKARERQYEAERRQHLASKGADHDRPALNTTVAEPEQPLLLPEEKGVSDAPSLPPLQDNAEQRADVDERQFLQQEWDKHHLEPTEEAITSPPATPYEIRPLPDPQATNIKKVEPPSPPPHRPLPDPKSYAAASSSTNGTTRVDRFLATNPAPPVRKPSTHVSNELSFDSAAERHREDTRREQAQAKTKAGGWASKSLLEREMELERQRQLEWEQAQMGNRPVPAAGGSVSVSGGVSAGPGAGTGMGIGGRRGIIGPRPPPS